MLVYLQAELNVGELGAREGGIVGNSLSSVHTLHRWPFASILFIVRILHALAYTERSRITEPRTNMDILLEATGIPNDKNIVLPSCIAVNHQSFVSRKSWSGLRRSISALDPIGQAP